MQGRGVCLHSKQHLQETNLCALQLCKGSFVSSNRPDLTAIAQNGLNKGIEQFSLDNWVVNVQLLASAVQAKRSAFGSFAEGLWGCCGGMHGGARILGYLKLINGCAGICKWWGMSSAAFKDHGFGLQDIQLENSCSTELL